MNLVSRALIADDEPHLAEYLQDKLVKLWPELDIVGIAANGPEALRLIEQENPDIAFLDIKMPGLSGLEVANRLTARVHVVFVTAFNEYAVEAFEQEAVDYLLKPATDERLQQTIARLKKRLATQEQAPELKQALLQLSRVLPGLVAGVGEQLNWIRASVGNQVRLIPVEEVCYFQANDKYVSVFTKEGEALIRLSLKELLDQLDPKRFWQIHRGTIVNLSHVAATSRDFRGHLSISLKTRDETLPVSRAYAHLFRQM